METAMRFSTTSMISRRRRETILHHLSRSRRAMIQNRQMTKINSTASWLSTLTSNDHLSTTISRRKRNPRKNTSWWCRTSPRATSCSRILPPVRFLWRPLLGSTNHLLTTIWKKLSRSTPYHCKRPDHTLPKSNERSASIAVTWRTSSRVCRAKSRDSRYVPFLS